MVHSAEMAHSLTVVLSPILVRSGVLVLSLRMAHSLIKVLSPNLVHSAFVVRS